MTWKDKLHPQVSKAEIEVFKELSKRSLTTGLLTQLDIILKKTKPDFCWPEKRKCVYLDGFQVHRSHEERDNEITNLLEMQGWNVLRITYHAPLGKERLDQILDEIEDFVGVV